MQDKAIMSTDPTPQLTALEQMGRYQLLQKLGEGGMGAVYLARDTKLDRRVALKVLPPHRINDAGAVARFQREAKALAKLSHPGIIQAYDADIAGGQHFLVMEYVEGLSLARLLENEGRIAPTLAADYLHQTALALQHAHEKGLIHRDLKPSNLLLTEQGRVKILDLGIARFLQDQVGDGGLTAEGALMGTPNYTSPEQFRNARSADVRSDIYSLGCTLYQLLGGQVPFPSSSLTEKCLAHEQEEPAPLEALCPEAPAGLLLVVRRMMAKRPAERFQTAQQVADALAPYVAGSSEVFGRLKHVASWDREQLTMAETRVFPKRKRWGLLALVLAVLLVNSWLVWMAFFRDGGPSADSPQLASASGGKPPEQPGRQQPAGDAQKGKEKRPREPVDPDLLTVSKDGRGKYDAIGKALAAVKPGQTIRVLDSATYTESLILDRPTAHAGVTLEAPQRATLRISSEAKLGITLGNVPRVTVRGFRIQGDSGVAAALLVHGPSPGVLLEDLEILPPPGGIFRGMTLEGVNLSAKDPPLVVQHCRFHPGATVGIRISGFANYQTPLLCKGIVIRDNDLEGCRWGIWAGGSLQRLHLVGNRIWDAGKNGIHLENLLAGTQDVLIANNTFLHCDFALQLWDDAVKGKNIQVRNNLVLGARQADLVFSDSGGSPGEERGPGDVQQVLKAWRVDHNWRELKLPQEDDAFFKYWIPAERDQRKDRIDVLSRTPTRADFLRPKKDSTLANRGAGQTDPSLPSYVGAVPPEGAEPWDWDRTWRAPSPGVLLTVSKDPGAGGEYRSLKQALAAVVKPNTTIRVLDEAVYADPLVIDRKAVHQGLVLETPKHATLLLSAAFPKVLQIRNVPDVRVRGFRFREQGAWEGSSFVSVSSHCPGTVLEDLDMQSPKIVSGVVLDHVTALPGEAPLVVRNCTIDVSFDGIAIAGPLGDDTDSDPARGIAIRGNRVASALRGIHVHGAVVDLHITGNVLWKCHQEGIGLEDLVPPSKRVLIANNTCFQSGHAFRHWDNAPFKKLEPGQVELCNNLFFEALGADMGYFLRQKEGVQTAGDAAALLAAWKVRHNWRDLSGTNRSFAIPLAPHDKKLGKNILTLDPSRPDFVRPPATSALAREGAGQVDPSLPVYVGAVPPAGAAVWDWDRTWRARVR
jgi:hypothetical protein